MVTVKWSELEMGFHFINSDGDPDSRALVSLRTGQIHWVSDLIDSEEELPDDLDDDTIYKPLPNKNELDLGRELVYAFVELCLPEEFDRVSALFSRRGAYRRFKDLLDRRGMLDAWHDFEHKATVKALSDWCAEHDIQIDHGA